MKDRDILDALKARAAEILSANGYNTNAGAQLYLGRVIDPEHDTIPCLVITQPDFDADVVEDDEDTTDLGMSSEFVVEGYLEVDQFDPLPDLMDLRADLVRGFYRPTPDRPDSLGALGCDVRLVSTTKLMPAPGARIGMAQLTLRIDYRQPIGD